MKFDAKFKKVRFLTSALHLKEFPHLKGLNGKPLPEIAIAGRSNVGKSSFINALLQSKTVAKTSSTPGKTQRINFFLIDEALLFVDLPGYGYARSSKTDIKNWSQAIDEYLEGRQTLRMIILCLDIRREPSPEDLAMAKWADAKGISLFALFTKRDKLSDEESERSIRRNLSLLGEHPSLAMSNQNFYERKHFIKMLNEEIDTWD